MAVCMSQSVTSIVNESQKYNEDHEFVCICEERKFFFFHFSYFFFTKKDIPKKKKKQKKKFQTNGNAIHM